MASEEWESWDDDQTYAHDDHEMKYEHTGLWAEEEPQDETHMGNMLMM